MKRYVHGLSLLLLTLALVFPASAAPAGAGGAAPTVTPVASSPEPFSRVAMEAGIGIMGINMQAATNINQHLNLRATGNYFTYSLTNVKVSGGSGASGVNVNGNLNFATMGASVDYYPFPNHGFRVSPGVMLLNQNAISANGVAGTGSSITLGSQKYYSEAANPLNLNAKLGLNSHPQTFTITTGWGNMISRRGGHWAFPAEIGAAFTGTPTVAMNLTGFACTNPSDAATNGPSCVNMATNTTAQTNLQAQITKYQNDLNPLKVYPILSFGVAYNFQVR